MLLKAPMEPGGKRLETVVEIPFLWNFEHPEKLGVSTGSNLSIFFGIGLVKNHQLDTVIAMIYEVL